jgi:hypothetical protein
MGRSLGSGQYNEYDVALAQPGRPLKGSDSGSTGRYQVFPKNNLFKIGVAVAAAAVGAILATTSVFAHATPTTAGYSIVGSIVKAEVAASFPLFTADAAPNVLATEQINDAEEAAELAAKIAAEQAELAAKLAAAAAAEAAEAAPSACVAADQTEDAAEKAADKAEDAAEKTGGTETPAEDTAEKARSRPPTDPKIRLK